MILNQENLRINLLRFCRLVLHLNVELAVPSRILIWFRNREQVLQIASVLPLGVSFALWIEEISILVLSFTRMAQRIQVVQGLVSLTRVLDLPGLIIFVIYLIIVYTLVWLVLHHLCDSFCLENCGKWFCLIF